MPELETAISDARGVARRDNHTLNAKTVEAVAAVREVASNDKARLQTPEYERDEYFVNCDDEGQTVPTLEGTEVETLSAGKHPWLRSEGEHLLVSRWLAHFIGFRHRVIHLFLDHPDHPDCTFAQIRSLLKYNSPGKLDMPIGGHVTGLDDFRSSLSRELQEELGLDIDRDVERFRELGTFNIVEDDDMPDHIEVEHATVYQGTITVDAMRRLQFQSDEVGALALFRIDELDRWIRERPKDVGGGMRESWTYYEMRPFDTAASQPTKDSH